MDLLQVLRRIEKRDRETEDDHPVHHLIPPQEYGVTLIEPDDQDFIPAIQTAIAEHHPSARVHLATFPKGKRGDKMRLLITTLLEAVGKPAPTRGQSTGDLMLKISLSLLQGTYFLIVDNAEYLNHACLHFLRRDKGMPPAILIGRNRRFFASLVKDEILTSRSLIIDSSLTKGQSETLK